MTHQGSIKFVIYTLLLVSYALCFLGPVKAGLGWISTVIAMSAGLVVLRSKPGVADGILPVALFILVSLRAFDIVPVDAADVALYVLGGCIVLIYCWDRLRRFQQDV